MPPHGLPDSIEQSVKGASVVIAAARVCVAAKKKRT